MVPLTENYIPQKSDIDLLVEFEEIIYPSLFGFAGLKIKLSEKIGLKVDLKTKEDLSIYFRDEVISEAKMVYEPTQQYGA